MAIDNVSKMVENVLMPIWQRDKEKLDRIDRWSRWDHDRPHKPKTSGSTDEYKELVERAQSPWGDLIVSSIAQTLYVEGYRRPDANDDVSSWAVWQQNHMDGRQVALHRAALVYGLAYVTVLPGRDPLTDAPMSVMRGVSPRQMVAVYADVAGDEWPEVAMHVRPFKDGYSLTVLDDENIYTLSADSFGATPKLDENATKQHGAGVCPVVRYANRFDLEGRSTGEIEPIIPLLGRIDQTTYDRLVVQRFAAWVVRTISGMSVDASAEANGVTVEQVIARLKVGDFLMSKDVDTKFGSLPPSPMEGFIEAKDADVRELASLTQSPVHEVLGQMANLSADALAAARASQTAKSDEIKHVFGEAHEQALRLAAHLSGDTEGAADFTAQVRWKDTQIRSLAQAADALGKMSQMLGVPLEMLWERIPGFTDFDVERAKQLVLRDDEVMRTLREVMDASEPTPPAEGTPGAQPADTSAA